MHSSSMVDKKNDLRTQIWSSMESENLVPYPLPLFGRIPNFYGAKAAAYKLCSLREFRDAKVVKIHPSLNATSLRFLALKFGKTVLTPPLPGNDILYFMLDPSLIPAQSYKYAACKKGFNKLGVPLQLNKIPQVDIVVVATVGCTRQGARVGKGKGYGEVEYGILRELNCVTDMTPVMTIVHDTQIVPPTQLPATALQSYDLPLDVICTPTQIIRTRTTIPKPTGIKWDLISEQMTDDIGALKKLKTLRLTENKD